MALALLDFSFLVSFAKTAIRNKQQTTKRQMFKIQPIIIGLLIRKQPD
jgi:hypothetical protein